MTNQTLKDKFEYWPIVIGLAICCFLCAITLFASSHRFVNAQITPKWLGMMAAIGIAGVGWSIRFVKKQFYGKSILLLLLSIFSFAFIRNWVTVGFNPVLFMYLSGLVFLFILLQQIVSACPPKYLYGTIIVFVVALSLHGILQYAGLISSGNKSFAVTGSFDNPAGFAVAVSCVFPLCFFFFTSQRKYIKYAAVVTSVLMATVVFLSGSRAGIVAMAAVITVWFFVKSKNWRTTNSLVNKTSKFILILVMLALPVVLYFLKKDSADGRLLIWRCTLDMVLEKPITGHGTGAFNAKCMLYQAEYFNTHPESQYAQLAGNTLHPFNEYLFVLCEYGLIGLAALVLLSYLLVRAYRRNPSNEKLTALISLIALAVFSLFSYPFRYPFTWVMLFLCMAIVCNPIIKNHPPFAGQSQSKIKNWVPRTVALLLSAGLSTYSVMMVMAEIKWNRLAHLSLNGRGREVLTEYNRLYRWLGKDGLFLYNFAAELHEAGEFEKSLVVFEHCTRYFNDMDVQMLMAINYKQLGRFVEAEQHFKLAIAMFPAKFVPMYELVNLYVANNCKDDALALARRIIDKEEKVTSPTVTEIKNQIQRLIQALEKLGDPEEDNKMSDETKNNSKTRQGETPETQSHGEALPP